MNKHIPKDVTLLTGFLGSGKTTLLNTLMAHRPQTRFALIENEYGQENIDGQLVVRPDVDITELSNGCLCCSLNNELLDVLEALCDRRDNFDELIIETTGIADPANVAVPFLMLPMVQREFTLKRVICLVDAELIEDQLRDTEEAIQQVSFADCILINKTDRVSVAYIDRLAETLRGLNPFATVLIGNRDSYPVAELMAVERSDTQAPKPASLTLTRKKTGESHLHEHTHTHDHPHAEKPINRLGTLPHRHHHHEHSDIVSLSFRFEESFDLTSLYHRLLSLLLFSRAAVAGKDIYRVKGIVYDASRNERWIVQSVSKTLTLTEGASWADDEDRITRIVFIGKLLKPAGFEKMLRHCLTKEPVWNITNSATLLATPTL